MSCDISKLGEVAEIIDSLHKTPKYSESGYPIVRVTDVKYGPLKLNKTYKVDEAVYKDFSRRYTPEVGDIVITRVGSYGNSAFVTDTNFCLGQNTAAIKPKINSRYLYYVLNSKTLQQQIEFSTVGSTQKTLSLKAISNLEIPRFAPAFENSVAKICGDLDDKIESNKLINQTLEQVAQAIFKSWFVDFEPVKAKINALEAGGSEEDALLAAMQAISGKDKAQLTQLQTENPERYNELHTTAQLFPSAMQDSELGEIPEGWKANKVGEIATAKGGYAFKSKQFQEYGNPVVKIKNIDGDGYVDIFNSQRVSEHTAKTAYRFKLDDGNLIMAMTGATVGKVGIVVTHGKSVYLNQRVAKFESEVFGPEVSWFLYCLFKRREIFELITGASQGSAQANVSSKGIEATPCVVPPISLLRAFIKVVRPLFQTRIKNVEQNRNLASIRNCLLPKLLAGDIELDGIQ